MMGMAARRLDLAIGSVAACESNPTPVPVPSSTVNLGKVGSMPELTKVAVIYYSPTCTVYELASFHHFGGIVVAPGCKDPVNFIDGNPYGTSHVNGQGAIPVDDTVRAAAAYRSKRVATIATAVKSGLAV
jgi:hypothetical protein